MTPADEEIETAQVEALAYLQRRYPAYSSAHEDLVNEAIQLARALWDGERPFVALVVRKTRQAMLSHIRKVKRQLAQLPPSSPDRHLTRKGLQQATIAECERRLLVATRNAVVDVARAWLAMPKDSLTYFERKAERRRAARAALDLLEREPSLVEVLDLATIKAWAHPPTPTTTLRSSAWVSLVYTVPVLRSPAGEVVGEGLQHYAAAAAAHGAVIVSLEERTFGASDTEAGVMSILSGNWPTTKAGMTAAEAIGKEADAIRNARARTRTGKK